jgi:protein O-GlcNAc transferase
MVNVFSFCLYGPNNPRYYIPLLENIQIVAQYFPGWKVYIYTGTDVDPEYIKVLQSYSNVVLRPTGIRGEANMIRRFMAIDEPDVDIMMVRDADSLIHWRDRWAIGRFISQPEYVAHTIRDHVDHTARLMGGLWGLRKSAGLVIADEYAMFKNNPVDFGIAHDQNFLSAQIYPKVLTRLFVHYSNGRTRAGEAGEAFPFAWSSDLFCGRIEYPQQRDYYRPIKFLPTTHGR